jgi:hypothetical protein
VSNFRKITESEAAKIARDSEPGMMLVMECGLLRELVKAKGEYIACQKRGWMPSERLLAKLARLEKELEAK